MSVLGLDAAIRQLELRAARRCDGYRVFWSLDDVQAARLLIAFIKQFHDPDEPDTLKRPKEVS